MTSLPSLRDVADAADAAGFVGRANEIQLLKRVLDQASPSRIFYVHGPGGIGKSALLRAARRIATAEGATVASLDGRTLPLDLDLLRARVLEAAQAADVVILDEADTLGSALAPLRDVLLDTLSARSRVILAGRTSPDPSWRADALHAIFVDLALAPLGPDDAAQLLEARGVTEPERRTALIKWAGGSPLALTVGASVLPGAQSANLAAELEQRVTQWLAGTGDLDVDPDVLAVAALCRTVDGRLLAAALPGQPTRDGLQKLADLRVTQRLGGGVSLHPVLAAAISERLREQSPERYRTLVSRIVEHLATRARLGDVEALIEVTLFVQHPVLRRAIAMEASPTHYADRPRPGELAQFAKAGGFDTAENWDELAAFVQLPGAVDLVMRRNDGTAVFFGSLVRASDLPGTELGRKLAESVELAGSDPQRSYAGIVLFADLPDADRTEATRISIGAFMRRHGLVDMEAVYIHYPEPARRPALVIAALAAPLEGSDPLVYVTDLRPGGAVAYVQRIIMGELGLEAKVPTNEHLLAPGEDAAREAELVRVLDAVFGHSPEEQRLRRAIELAHTGPRRSQQECLEDLHVSRATWFRLLREARARVLSAPMDRV